MEQRRSAIVIPFPVSATARQSPTRSALVGAPQAVPAPPPLDAARNAEWDQLMQLCVQAWTWRDPESLEALQHAAAALAGRVASEWST